VAYCLSHMPLLQQLLSTEEGVYSWRVPGTSVRSRFPNLPLPSQTAALGHEDQFRPPSLNGGCRLGKATFAGMGGKEEDAPKPAVRAMDINPHPG